MSKSFIGAVSLFVHTYQIFNVQHILVHKGCSLVDESIFSIKDFWISGINYILNDVCIFVHFRLVFVFTTLSRSFFPHLIFILSPFLSIFTHHILFADLVEAFTHFAQLHVLES